MRAVKTGSGVDEARPIVSQHDNLSII